MSDEKKSKGRVVAVIFGFLVLAGGIALITLGLVFAYPDFDIFILPNEIYFAAAGIAGLLIAIILLIIGFRKHINAAEVKEKELEKLVSSAQPPPKLEKATTREEIKAEKAAMKAAAKAEAQGDIICYKCGTANNSINYYCSNCKSALLRVCPFCGHGNNPNNSVCEGCEKVF